MSTATDKLQSIQVWEQPTQTVVIPQDILEVLSGNFSRATMDKITKPKPTRKPRK